MRAIDEAGNTDQTPASRAFSVERKIALTLEAAQAAAAMYFPDTLDFDVPSTCGGSPAVDCPSGTAVPPADQLRFTSSRSVVEVPAQSRFDLIATSGIQTLVPIKVAVPLAGDCDVNVSSSPGAQPTWQFSVPMQFVVEPGSGDYRIVPGDMNIAHAEADDFSLTGNFSCQIANPGFGFFLNIITDSVDEALLRDLCAAPGPAYMEPCPGP